MTIEVITGPMYSGKTTILILKLAQAEAVSQRVRVFKPRIDIRVNECMISSRLGWSLEAISIEKATDIFHTLDADTHVVAVDEGQFFGDDLVEVSREISARNTRVLIAGLDLDFRREPFGPIPKLMAMADILYRLEALCSVCGEPARFSQRLHNGCPARYCDSVVQVGDSQIYEARCHIHHVVVDRPTLAF